MPSQEANGADDPIEPPERDTPSEAQPSTAPSAPLELPARPNRALLYWAFAGAVTCESLAQVVGRFDLAPAPVSTLLSLICGCLLVSLVYYVVRLSQTLRLIRVLVLLSGICIVAWGGLDILVSLTALAHSSLGANLHAIGRPVAIVATVGFISSVMLGFMLSLLTVLDANYLLAREQKDLRQEVADRRRAELALRQSELRQRVLYNSVHAGIVVQTSGGAIVDTNHVAAETFGLAIDEVRGRTTAELGWRMVDEHGASIPERDRPALRTARTASPIRDLVVGVTHDSLNQVHHWLLVNTEPLFEPFQEQVSEVLITFQDITALKQAQMELHASESRFRTIFDTSPTAIMEVDASALKTRIRELRDSGVNDLPAFLDSHPDEVANLGSLVRILDFNAATVRIMNASSRDSVNRTLPNYFADGSLDVFKEQILELAQGALATEHEMPIVNAAGHLVWLTVSLAIQPGYESTLERILVSFIDVTARKRAEEERLRLERQIQQTQRLESLGVLAGGIAHDFNNILMAILGHADMAQDELAPGSPVRDSLAEIELAARRAAELCRQMLAYSGRGRFIIETISLRDVVEEMVQLLSASISPKAVVELHLDSDAKCMSGDATQIRQIVMNLVVNAAESLHDDPGSITVATGIRHCTREYLDATIAGESLVEGEYVFLRVTDTGCGMAPDTLTRIFEPFFTTKFTGRGLGMSAVLGIVRGHKGALTIQSEPNKGSAFTVLFPAVEEKITMAEIEPKSPQAMWKGSGSVLVVDDERQVRALGKRMLRRLGFETLLANDGLEAISVYTEHREETVAVILDLTMPNMDGEEALRELHRINPDLPVILSSGFTEHEIAPRFKGKGLAGFIQKPYTIEVLRDRLRELIEGAGPASATSGS